MGDARSTDARLWKHATTYQKQTAAVCHNVIKKTKSQKNFIPNGLGEPVLQYTPSTIRAIYDEPENSDERDRLFQS